jgi:hypothetical protein
MARCGTPRDRRECVSHTRARTRTGGRGEARRLPRDRGCHQTRRARITCQQPHTSHGRTCWQQARAHHVHTMCICAHSCAMHARHRPEQAAPQSCQLGSWESRSMHAMLHSHETSIISTNSRVTWPVQAASGGRVTRRPWLPRRAVARKHTHTHQHPPSATADMACVHDRPTTSMTHNALMRTRTHLIC